MRMKLAFFSALLFCSFPVLSYAIESEIHVTNNTSLYGTGSFWASPCSSVLGDIGIAKPHDADFTIPTKVITMFCAGSTCEAYIYASKNCSGSKKATVKVNAKDGVIKIENHDPKHFTVSGTGMHIVVNEISPSFTDWIKSIF